MAAGPDRWITWAGWGLVTLAAGLVLVMAAGSLDWPLIHDAPLMSYIAWRIDERAVPYADLFDMNFPGTYLVHLAVVKVLGTGDGGWRAFDLSWLGGTAAAMAWVCAPWGRHAAALAALTYVGYHLSAGPVQAGQRDYLLILPCMLAVGWASRALDGRGLAWAAVAGLAMGVAVTIKPTPVLLWAALGLAGSLPAWRRGEAPLGPPVVMLLAGLVPMALVGLWLASLGGLGPFLEVLTGYVLPLYARVGRVGIAGFISARHWLFVAGMGALACWAAALAHRGGGLGSRRALLGVAVAYGALHYLVQGKGWGYHLAPLVAFAGCLAASGLGSGGAPAARGMLLAGLGAVWIMIGVKGLPGGAGPEVRARVAQVAEMQAQVHRCASGGGTVQVFDTAHGAIHALLRERIRQPTRFIYDFPLFHDAQAPYIQGLRAEVVAALRAAPPACVLLVEQGWPSGGYERFEQLPDLMGLLGADYRRIHDGNGYRVYGRRED